LLARRPTPGAGGPLLVVCPRLFIVFAANLNIKKPSHPPATRGRAMLWCQEPT